MNLRARFLSILVLVLVMVMAVSASAANPVLVITKTANPFSTYLPEILRSEGMNSFDVADLSQVSATTLANYDLAIMGEMSLTSAQVSMFTTWVNGGGNLIAMRPDAQLASLVGVTGPSGTLADKYLAIDTTTRPGAGIVADTIQYHGAADVYSLSGATAVATLYSNATTTTSNPAVTLRAVGSGNVAAFTYDLARSVVYTRQGNPAWSAQERDGTAPIRPDDLFFGNKSGDVQPDWVDLNKVAIPQADEQQRLLVNLMLYMSGGKKPLPRFWYFPKGVPATVVMTGDDHGNGGTGPRFDQFIAASTSGCSVADWECIRSTSYVYPNTPITNPANYVNQGFEIGLHVNTNCGDFFGFSDLDSYFQTQLSQWGSAYPTLTAPKTNRTHCIAFSDYDTEPQVELSHGMRFDTNYYYWPGSWINNRPGMFTGSGMPQRFATSAGSLVDVYQATTQMTDESDQSFPSTIDSLLNNAVNGKGFYGAFTANMHTDSQTTGSATWAGQIVSSAKSLGVPVVSSLQMLQWLDGRNNSTFNITSWAGNVLSFNVTAATGARNLRAMLPTNFGSAGLTSIKQGTTTISYTVQTIKGIQYAMFAATTGSYTATYGGAATFSISGSVLPAPNFGSTTVNATGTANASATVDAYGNYTINGLPAGTYTLTPTNSGGGFVPANRVVTLSNDNLTGINFSASVACPCTLWPNSAVPNVASTNDSAAVELGVRFRADANGTITGIRFYKGTANTGTHTASLWSNTGTLLRTATFSGESASGWQTVTFSQPVPVTANTLYVASYHTNAGNYALDLGYFGNGVDNSPLHAPADGVSGANGIYRYGSTSGFPTNTYQSSNYWVDVVFMMSATTYSISGTLGGAGATGATVALSGASTATVTADSTGAYVFTNLPNGSYTITPSKTGVVFSPPSQNVTVNGGSVTANFTSTVLTYTISGTVSGAVSNGVNVSLSGASSATTSTDASGNFSFTGVVSGSYSVTPSSSGYAFTPTTRSITVSGADVTGVNFTSAVQTTSISGVISGAGGNGATVTLGGASSATTTSDAAGNYTFTAVQNGSYTVTPSKAGFVFTPPSQNVTVTGTSVSGVNFTSAGQTFAVTGTITGATVNAVTITASGSSSASTSTDASGNFSLILANGSYTITPSKAGFTFTPVSRAVSVNGAAVSGVNFVSASSTSGGSNYSIWSPSAVPGGSGANDPSAVELGVKFRSDVDGTITGIRFYKGSTNTGTHTGSLWTTTGTLLATATFTGESASGWQQVVFTQPVAITANTVYIASYHTNTGNYAFDPNYWVAGVDNPPLHALADGVAGGNGVYVYGAGGTFPTNTYQASNYWVDVVLNVPAQTYSISGTISGPGGNGATVTLGGAASGSTTADASGNYTFTGLSGGSYTLSASKTGFTFSPTTQSVTISLANVTGVNFSSVAQGFSISGAISGAGGNGATVILSGASAATTTADASGNYTFAALANGSYTVTPSKTGLTFTPSSQNVTVSSADVSAVNFTAVGNTFSISGTLSGTGGNAATVTLGGISSATTTADTSGNYSFTGLVDGAYSVTPSKAGFNFTPGTQSVTVSGANVTGINFSSAAQTFTISGTISGTGGNLATVSLTGAATSSTTTDAAGNYSFSGLANGSYTVTPTKAGFVFAPANQAVTVSGANRTAINFTSAAQTFSIGGTISGTGGNAATVTLSGTSTATVAANASGVYSFSGLANGSYTVTPSKAGYTFAPVSQAVTVSGASLSGVNFNATPNGLAVDLTTFTDRSANGSTIISPALTTRTTNELLLAFVSTDGTTLTTTTVTGVTGGGLTWTLVRRTNTQRGTAEIWRAFAPSVVTNATVTASLSRSSAASITVVAFTGADITGTGGSGAIGAVGGASGTSAPTASIVTTRANSYVFAVGNDITAARARTVGANQTLVHQFLSTSPATFWVQRQNATIQPAGTTVTINDTAPTTDRFNLSLVEILARP